MKKLYNYKYFFFLWIMSSPTNYCRQYRYYCDHDRVINKSYYANIRNSKFIRITNYYYVLLSYRTQSTNIFYFNINIKTYWRLLANTNSANLLRGGGLDGFSLNSVAVHTRWWKPFTAYRADSLAPISIALVYVHAATTTTTTPSLQYALSL